MFIDPQRVLERIQPNDRVLDVGGWCGVFPRADAVIDINPYETRLKAKPEEERFNPASWFRGDLCEESFWSRFKDKEFDFTICSHVLEDVRDPLVIARQLQRISKAGYIEFPSKWRECTRRSFIDSSAGCDHHRWIITVEDNCRLVLTGKFNVSHLFNYPGRQATHLLTNPNLEWTGFFWRNSFDYVERTIRPFEAESEDLFRFFKEFDYDRIQNVHDGWNVPEETKQKGIPAYRIGHVEWWEDFQLPIENHFNRKQLQQKHRFRYVLAYGTWRQKAVYLLKRGAKGILKPIDTYVLGGKISRWLSRNERMGHLVET